MSSVDSSVSEIKQDEVSDKKVELSVEDIQTIVNIIDVGSQRGAFRGPELKGIGGFYEKLQELINPSKDKTQ
mgnify:CR=1 FL=1|tara:strand:+ start:312 stop:527 length:216 start_codon:yes stop_codon:yes gene_type:complete